MTDAILVCFVIVPTSLTTFLFVVILMKSLEGKELNVCVLLASLTRVSGFKIYFY